MYSTIDEKHFILRLGRFSEAHGLSYLDLLVNYRDAMDSRKNWGEIEKEKIAKLCDELINAELNKDIDGAEWVGRVSRNPDGVPTSHQGGGLIAGGFGGEATKKGQRHE